MVQYGWRCGGGDGDPLEDNVQPVGDVVQLGEREGPMQLPRVCPGAEMWHPEQV